MVSKKVTNKYRDWVYDCNRYLILAKSHLEDSDVVMDETFLGNYLSNLDYFKGVEVEGIRDTLTKIKNEDWENVTEEMIVKGQDVLFELLESLKYRMLK
jgi:hypothetical protein